jgi:prepilin-type N-terminal cleavage/methylation domain-containing protein
MASLRATRDLTRRLRRRLEAQDGFTLIEVLVAITILVIGIFGTVATFDHSRKATTSSERIESMAHLAQSESEKLTALAYASIGLTAADVTANATNSGTSDTWDPRTFIQNAPKKFSPDWQNTAAKEDFVACTTGCPSFKTAWNDGRFSGDVYRFITWVNDNCAGCSNNQDYKRVMVVVTNPGHAPFINSTVVRNPK